MDLTPQRALALPRTRFSPDLQVLGAGFFSLFVYAWEKDKERKRIGNEVGAGVPVCPRGRLQVPREPCVLESHLLQEEEAAGPLRTKVTGVTLSTARRHPGEGRVGLLEPGAMPCQSLSPLDSDQRPTGRLGDQRRERRTSPHCPLT